MIKTNEHNVSFNDLAEYKSCERATEVLEEMLQKYAAGEKIYHAGGVTSER